MDRFFNMDNKFFVFMGRVADLIILNLLCIVCCIPIITAGASITAMFYVTLKMVRNEESYIIRSFFKSFKENFKQATIIHLIMLVTALLLFFDIRIVNQLQGSMYQVLFVIFMAFTVLYLMIFLYIYPVLSKFYNTIKATFTNAFLMAIRHLPYTLLMLVITAVPVALLFIPDARVMSTLMMLFVLVGFALIAYCNSFFFVKIFDNYIPKEEDAGDSLDSPGNLPDNGDQA
ncbi:MAG: DUF624 domain-containing protein [Eubacteriales bacterium]|nr:DUF624 domain-containing protein [Eubacteriales bacterium]